MRTGKPSLRGLPWGIRSLQAAAVKAVRLGIGSYHFPMAAAIDSGEVFHLQRRPNLARRGAVRWTIDRSGWPGDEEASRGTVDGGRTRVRPPGPILPRAARAARRAKSSGADTVASRPGS